MRWRPEEEITVPEIGTSCTGNRDTRPDERPEKGPTVPETGTKNGFLTCSRVPEIGTQLVYQGGTPVKGDPFMLTNARWAINRVARPGNFRRVLGRFR